MRVAFLTAGDPDRLTGGYLYHARVFSVLGQRGVVIDEIVVSSDASRAAQRHIAPDVWKLSERVLDADVVVIDALAAIACHQSIAGWQAVRPLVAMVHELPSVAGDVGDAVLLDAEDRLLAADLVIAVSRHGADILVERGVAADRIRIVSPGCDRVGGQPEQRRSRAGRLRGLAVAQWIPRKGIDTLVEAWGLVRHANADLELIGETGADPEYETFVRSRLAAASQTIEVRGTVSDDELARAYARADLFVLPSRYEGYGMVYAEALLHGLPVIACDCGPVPELLGPDAGLLVPAGDVTALAVAIDRLLADAALRERMSAAAIRRGRELPTWAETATAFEAALHAAIRVRRA